MATQQHRIVAADASEIHDEPHVKGSRITIRDLHERVEQRGLSPIRVAERFDIDVATVYAALAYYHANPEEMRAVEARHERAVEEARRRSTLEPADEG